LLAPPTGQRRPWPGIEDERVLRKEDIEGGARAELPGHLSMGDVVNLGRPVVFPPNDEVPLIVFARPAARETGRGQVGEPPAASPGLIDLQRRAVMLPGRTAVVPS
jgi:hypothetical protein